MFDVDSFSAEQKRFLALIVDDLGGPTATAALLMVLERVMYSFKPDWELESFNDEPEMRDDIAVCMAALSYYKVQEITKAE